MKNHGCTELAMIQQYVIRQLKDMLDQQKKEIDRLYELVDNFNTKLQEGRK